MRTSTTDYLVVGAGAMGMAFTDALIDHADVHVTLVDRRHAASGHWQDAYPFVRLHQASCFYGVASTVLGSGVTQEDGPEAGLQERARQSEIQAYYDSILDRRFMGSGRVTFLGGCEHHTDGSSHLVTSLVSGETVKIDVRRRVVDATYLSPTIPATTPPPFGVDDGVHVAPINELARLTTAPSSYVIVGSGKTATDGIVWLLAKGVPPDHITWIRPRDPWMLNRAVVQPHPVVALGLAADTMAAAADAASLDDLFLRLEAAGVMMRVDRNVMPTMAKTPTLGTWELELLRSIERVVRRGHVKHVTGHEIVLDDGSVPLAPGALVVHCAASGLVYPPLVPLWGRDVIRLQTIRVGFPCFCAALAGYVEATRDDDRERNRLCPPNTLPDSLASWAQMQVLGTIATGRYGAEPDIAEWANRCALNPARIEPSQHNDPAVQAESAAPDRCHRARTRTHDRARRHGLTGYGSEATASAPASDHRSRPSSFASYIARSACSSISAADRSTPSNTATPMLALRRTGAPSTIVATLERMSSTRCCATVRAPAPSLSVRSTTNSSPPSRATKSDSRRRPCS